MTSEIESFPVVANGSTLICAGPGRLIGVDITKAGKESDIALYDGVDALGRAMHDFQTAEIGSFAYAGHRFTIGLFVIASGKKAASITVRYITGA